MIGEKKYIGHSQKHFSIHQKGNASTYFQTQNPLMYSSWKVDLRKCVYSVEKVSNITIDENNDFNISNQVLH